jgi:NTE family protein
MNDTGGSMPRKERKHIDLALQGGGSHGALTWGVLDRLLEEEPATQLRISAQPRRRGQGMTGSASGGMSIALAMLGDTYLAMGQAAGISPELLITVGTLVGSF